ncbi:MAG: site-specific DNA-methyltransferase [Exiguobacterium sp.]|nr:site-specific DNA-methyltransferase [Exiguobacterium sp.]
MENQEFHKFDMHLFRDSMQNYKVYQIPKAQLIIADVPYNLGTNAYGSNPSWYVDGYNKNGESDKAGKKFFNSENEFRPAEFMHFCSKMLVKEPKEKGKAPCMILFCEFEQQFKFIELAKKYGFPNYINLVFRKNFSAQVLKANMKIVGNCEYGLLFYRDKLPKFNNRGKMIFNCIDWERDTETPKVHPTQKPVALLKKLIDIFTDEGEVVIDPCCGSGTTLLAAQQMMRRSYGFEVDKNFFNDAKEKVLSSFEPDMFQMLEFDEREKKKQKFMSKAADDGQHGDR